MIIMIKVWIVKTTFPKGVRLSTHSYHSTKYPAGEYSDTSTWNFAYGAFISFVPRTTEKHVLMVKAAWKWAENGSVQRAILEIQNQILKSLCTALCMVLIFISSHKVVKLIHHWRTRSILKCVAFWNKPCQWSPKKLPSSELNKKIYKK